ncbi:MAG: MTAP family purine nucleoside phosphorylase [Candidatus Uhrbacteria bacterium]|nr:MTAP family purine nucleoside phosphorylase [Candidatus Uhrbacteria bacterium]
MPLIAVIGGSGLETFPDIKILDRVRPKTLHGEPSDELLIAEHGGHPFVFLPRHGAQHQLPPHRIPYRANLMALKALGVKTVVSTCIVGSLKRKVAPGHFIIPDQFVNFTWGRDDGPRDGTFVHLPMAEPYCRKLRDRIPAAVRSSGATVHTKGTIVVIQGPRFSTKAESQFFIRNGWDIVNMTQYPECSIARELGLCYATIASVTDWDVGISSNVQIGPSNMNRVLKVFRKNVQMTKTVILTLVEHLNTFRCGCAERTIVEYYKPQ